MKAIELANYIVDRAFRNKTPVSNLKLLKILYLVHRDFYRRGNGPLIDDCYFEAWKHGPVILEVYYNFRFYGARPIENQIEVNVDSELKEFLDSSIDKYLAEEPWDLVAETHKEDGAWRKFFKEGQKVEIPEEMIKREAQDV